MRRILVGLALLAVAWLLFLLVQEPAGLHRTTLGESNTANAGEVRTDSAAGATDPSKLTAEPGQGESSTKQVWRVRLLNRGRPLVAVRVGFVRDMHVQAWTTTDSEGWATVEEDDEAFTSVSAAPYVENHRIESRVTTIRLELLPFEVVLKDVKTGERVDGGIVTLVRGSFRKPMDRRGGAFVLDGAPLDRGHHAQFALQIIPPEGWSAPGYVQFNGRVSRRASKVRLEVPLGPELRRQVQVTGAEGHRIPGAMVTRFEVDADNFDGRNTWARIAPSDALGRIEFRQIPYARGYWVGVSFEELSGRDIFWIGGDATVVLDDTPELWRSDDDTFVMPDPRWGSSRGKRRLVVRCFRADGRPAAGLQIVLLPDHIHAVANGQGVAEIFRDDESGFLEVEDEEFVSPGPVDANDVSEAVIREAALRSVRLRFETNQPAALAQLHGGRIKVVDGVQVEGTFTNLDGSVTLQEVSAGLFRMHTARGWFWVPASVEEHTVKPQAQVGKDNGSFR